MKLQHSIRLALALACLASVPADAQQSQRASIAWPPSFAIVETAERLLHCELSMSQDDVLTLRIEELDGPVALRDRQPATHVILPGDSSPMVGGLDVARLPGHDLVVSAAFAVGASHHLRVWRLTQVHGGGYRVASSAVFERARLRPSSIDAPAVDVELFACPRALATAAGVVVFVAAQPTDRSVECSERVIVRLALSNDLGRIESAAIVAHGGDPRIGAHEEGFVLAVRTPADGYEDVNAAPLALLTSTDGRTWTTLEPAAAVPQVDASYSLVAADSYVWVVSNSVESPSLNTLWRFDPLRREWSERGSVQAPRPTSAARAPTLWLSSNASSGQRPVLMFESGSGLANK